MRGGRKLHWHIDYLRREARVVEVWYLVSEERLECDWYQAVADMPDAEVLVDGFGSSGCKCRSHLVYFKSMPLWRTSAASWESREATWKE